jgi:hypothetical protein
VCSARGCLRVLALFLLRTTAVIVLLNKRLGGVTGPLFPHHPGKHFCVYR